MKCRNDITSIIEFYDSSKEEETNSTYSRIFDNNYSSGDNFDSINLNSLSKPDKTKTFKYNTWEITGEHDGIFEKKKSTLKEKLNAMSYFSKTKGNVKAQDSAQPEQKPNMFREAIKRNSDIISNVNKQGEEMKFKRFEQYISLEVRGVKKIYDIFELFNGTAKTIDTVQPKESFSQKISSFFSRKSKK